MILSSPVDVSVPTVSLTHTYPPVIKHGNWKSLIHEAFNRKFIHRFSGFSSHVWFAERKMHWNQSKPWRFHQPTIQRTRIWIKRMPGRGTGDLGPWNRLTWQKMTGGGTNGTIQQENRVQQRFLSPRNLRWNPQRHWRFWSDQQHSLTPKLGPKLQFGPFTSLGLWWILMLWAGRIKVSRKEQDLTPSWRWMRLVIFGIADFS